jgi:lipoic acid synthetase
MDSRKAGRISTHKPSWLRRKLPSGPNYEKMRSLLRNHDLVTVCKEAHCPNQFECFSSGTATFMILGDRCTRNCRYCAVLQHPQGPPDPDEPRRIAGAAVTMGLQYIVITSVTRDDLEDGGADHFKKTIEAVRLRIPEVRVEVLIPDLQGNYPALAHLLEAAPSVLNHNLETVERLYPRVRPEADYSRSLKLLRQSKIISPEIPTKSGIMVGLGETREDLEKSMADLLAHDCDILTLGQYLQPSKQHLPVERFLSPEEFEQLRLKALDMGFKGVASGPMVRSSYNAGQLFREVTGQSAGAVAQKL